jgi:hypothetical protein
MSVATYATVIKDKSEIETVRQKKEYNKGGRVKTQKRKYDENIDSKLSYAHPANTSSNSAAVQNIHSKMNQYTNDSDINNSIGNFTPYSQYREQPIQEPMNTLSTVQNSNIDMNTVLGGNGVQPSHALYKQTLMENNSFGSELDNVQRSTEIYQKTLPYKQMLKNQSNDDILMQKLNYIITLLEDQKDEKTDNVTEEVVLYSFLGIFIIFVADSFSKVGKYVR